MFFRLLKLAEIMAAEGDTEGLAALDVRLAGLIKKQAHMVPENDGKTPNPWRRNMDYGGCDNSPYFGSIGEFMKKYPGGIKDWVEARKKDRVSRYKKWDINKRKAFVLHMMKKGEIDYDDLSGDYEPTQDELEYAERNPSTPEKERALQLLLNNIEMIKEMAGLSDDEVKSWLEKNYGKSGIAADDDGTDTDATLEEVIDRIKDPETKFDLLKLFLDRELLSHKAYSTRIEDEKKLYRAQMQDIGNKIENIKKDVGVSGDIKFKYMQDKVAHYIPEGGDDVANFEGEPHLYSGEMDKYKSIKEYLGKYHGAQDASDAAFDAVQDFVKYWRTLLKRKSK